MNKVVCKYGTHRVLEPQGVLPQPAWKIDNSMKIYDNELLINVDTLNIDAASFTQIKKQAQNDPQAMAKIMLDIVAQRGKHHNPTTGSGGMLMGTVAEIGPQWQGKTPVKVGDRIATLVSLSLTPLAIHKIKEIHMEREQVEVDAQAILFSSGIYAVPAARHAAFTGAGGIGCRRCAGPDSPSCASPAKRCWLSAAAESRGCFAFMRRKREPVSSGNSHRDGLRTGRLRQDETNGVRRHSNPGGCYRPPAGNE